LQGLGAGHELAGRDATSVIAELKHAGILITTSEYRDAPLLFLHRTFHEYLVARALAQRAQAEGWGAIAVLLDRKAWRPAWQEVIVLLAGQLADPVPLLLRLADGRRDDLFRHRLALAALCLTEIPADVRDPLVVDGIATEIVTVWVKHECEETQAVVAHLLWALSAIGQASRQGLGKTRWGMRLLTLCRDTDRRVRRAAVHALGGLGAAAAPALDRLLELTRNEDREVRRAADVALNRIMARGVWIFKVPGWKRFFLGNRVVRRLEELDPEQPATS